MILLLTMLTPTQALAHVLSGQAQNARSIAHRQRIQAAARVKLKAKITKPDNNDLVDGTIEIKGTATSPDFSSYTLSFAPQSAPDQQTLIGEYYQQVTSDRLADWDTTTVPDGDYVLTLTVFEAQEPSASDSVNVRLDNQPPTLSISSPLSDGAVMSPFEVTGTVADAHIRNWTLLAQSRGELLLCHMDGNTVNERTTDEGNLTGEPSYSTGKYAQGLHIIEGQGLTYPKDHNIESGSGTVEFWFTPDWPGDEVSEHILFYTKTEDPSNPTDCLKLFHGPEGLVLTVYDHEGQPRSATIPTDAGNLPEGVPAHIAATWGDGSVGLVLNGVASTQLSGGGTGRITELGRKIYIGFYPEAGLEADATFDEISIHDYERPLCAIRADCLADAPRAIGETDYEVARGTETADNAPLGTVTASDGPAEALSLSLKAKDRNGHSSALSQTVFMDNPQPAASISSPAEGAQVSGVTTVEGTCFDMDLASWTLSAKPGDASSPGDWIPIASGTETVWRGGIADWDTTALSGPASLRLEVTDSHGKSAVATRTVSVLSAGPLTADIVSPAEGQAVDSSFQVTGTASGANFSGYTLEYREKSPSFLCHFNDNTGNERDADTGTITGSPAFQPGKFENGLFMGTSDTLRCPTTGNMQAEEGTVELWVTPNWSASESHTRMLFFTPATSGYSNMLALAKDSGHLLFYTYDQSGQPKVVSLPITDEDIQPGVPFHLGATWDNGDIRLNLNGKEALPAEGQPGTGIFSSLGQDLYVGSSTFGMGAEAVIDELSIYPWVRSQAAILEDAHATEERTYHADWETVVESATPVSGGVLGTVSNDPIPGEGIELRLTATAAGQSEEDTVSLVRDSASPRAEITDPQAGGLVYGTRTIKGTASDIDLASYQLLFKAGSDPNSPDPWLPVAPPSSSVVVEGTLASWDTSGLADGAYLLRLVASDLNGKNTTYDRAVILNNQVPSAEITFPADGGAVGESCDIRGTASGPNFSSYTLSYHEGTDVEGPGDWILMGEESTTPVTGGALGTWDTSSLPESAFMLRLTVNGIPGMVITDTISISVDHTAPQAEISSPEDGATIAGYARISGTATDANFGTYSIEYAGESDPENWQPACGPFTAPVSSGTLAYWNVEGIPDGVYLLRLSVEDKAGHDSQRIIHLQVDNPASYTIESISLDPTGTMLAVGETCSFTCLAIDTQGYSHLVIPAWEATGSNGTIDASGLFTAVSPGAGAVRATFEGFTAEAPTSVVNRVQAGILTRDTTWSASDNPIVIDGWLIVPREVTLTIQSGTVVKFVSGGIYVEGSFLTQMVPGQDKPVLTSVKDDDYCGDTNADGSASAPLPGDWSALFLAPGADTSISTPSHFKYGGKNTNTTIEGNRRVVCSSELYSTSGTLTLGGCTFEKSAANGLTVVGEAALYGNTFIDNGLWGCQVASWQATSSVSGCHFLSGNYGLLVTGEYTSVDCNDFSEVSTAIAADGFTRTSITNNTMMGGGQGILVDFDERVTDAGGPAIEVAHNHMSGGTGDGIVVQSSEPGLVAGTTQITENDVTGNAGAGIRVSNTTSNASISGNDPIQSCGWGIQAGSVGHVSIDDNVILNSAYTGVFLDCWGYQVGGTVSCSGNRITGRRGGGNSGIHLLYYENSCFAQTELAANTITSTDTAITGRSYKGDNYPAATLTVRDNTVTDSGGFADLWTFKDVEFADNTNVTTQAFGVTLRGAEDDAFRGASARFNGNTISCSYGAIGLTNYDIVDIGTQVLNTITGGGVGASMVDRDNGVSFDARNNVLSGSNASLGASGYASNTITDNRMTGGGGIGVGDHSGDCVVSRNILSSGGGGGEAIRVQGQGDCVIRDNQVPDRFSSGIQVFNKSHVQIQKNTVEHCGTGIEVQNSLGGGGTSSITDNYFNGCDLGGRFAVCDAVVTRNAFTEGSTGLSVLGDTEERTPTLHHNRICGNSYWGLDNPSYTYQVGTKDDWWGSASGPNPPGSGDRIDPERVNLFGFKGLRTRRGYCGMAGEPVNTATGAFEYDTEDLSLPGRGPALNITRSYNSADPTKDTPLGFGWGFNYDCYIERDQYFGGTSNLSEPWVTLVQGGYETMFFANADGSFTPQKGCFDTLTRALDQTGHTSGFVLDRKDHTNLRFTRMTQGSEIRYMLDRVVDRNGNQLLLAYENCRLETSTDAAGRVLSFTWKDESQFHSINNHILTVDDSAGRSVSYSYNDDGDMTSYTDAGGHTTTYEYAPAHYLTKVIEPGGEVFLENHYKQQVDPDKPWQYMKVDWQRDGMGAETRFYYDIFVGDPDLGGWTWILEPGEDYPSRDHRFDHDLNLHQDVSPEGFTTIYWYDEYGNRNKVSVPNWRVTQMDYDTRGNLLSLNDPMGNLSSFTYDGDNNLTSATDALLNATVYDYDGHNNLVSIDYPDPAGSQSFTYWQNGLLTTTTDSQGHQTSYDYDAQGNLSAVTDPLERATSYDYSLEGLLASTTDPLGHRTSFEYDGAGNLLKVEDPLSQEDPLGHHYSSYSWYPDNNLQSFTDPNGNSTSYTYDGNNQLASITDAMGKTTTYSYDENWNLGTIRDARPEHYTTTFSYDNDNRLVSIDDPSDETPVAMAYDPAGNVTQVNQPSGETTHCSYDDNSQLTGLSFDISPLSYDFTYTQTNRLESATDNNGHLHQFFYDEAGRLTNIDEFDPSPSLSFSTAYQYDDLSQRTGLFIPGFSQSMDYNAAGELESVAVPADTTYRSHFSHYPDGNLQQISNPDGSTRSYSYDAAGRITEITNHTTSGDTSTTYGRDNNGNVTSVDGYPTYLYDSLNRLTDWFDYSRGIQTHYTYDEVGNLLQVTENGSTVRSYAYDGANRITTGGFAYDANGNMTSDGEKDYTYDALDRLVRVEDSDTHQVIATYTYDFMGRRTSKTVSGETTYFHYDGIKLIAETDSSGTLEAGYAYDDAGDPLAMVRNGSTYYYQTNFHRDVVALTDSTGSIVNSYSYDPWGRVLAEQETVENPLRYAGYIYDGETGLYYLMARYYAPSLAHFVQEDHIERPNLRSIDTNLYKYCDCNPIVRSDRTGRNWLSDFLTEVGPWVSPFAAGASAVIKSTTASAMGRQAADCWELWKDLPSRCGRPSGAEIYQFYFGGRTDVNIMQDAYEWPVKNEEDFQAELADMALGFTDYFQVVTTTMFWGPLILWILL
ncbi:MAG: right-handed parallel beta-helix repeat-containing protein [Actinobacteria bacterium]|nr:right-handed parallel beta-helix repeat-containing protein [Actinomycetota bacterium]